MSDWIWIAMCILFVIVGPLIGCILAGIDRKISARMQNRVGPPILQPLYDVKKFLAKEQVTPNKVQDFYVMVFLLFTIVTGAMFFAGMDLLLVIFSLTLAETFLVLAAYSSGSVYSQIGAQRELYVGPSSRSSCSWPSATTCTRAASACPASSRADRCPSSRCWACSSHSCSG